MLKKFFESEKNFNLLIATEVLLILAIPVGIANVVLGYIIGESPCTLCWFERTGMILIGVLGVMVLRYGLRMRYLAAMAFSSFFGLYMTLRHTSMLLHQDQGQGFGDAMFGAHTYSWGVFVYWVSVLALVVILLFVRPNNPVSQDLAGTRKVIKPLSKYSKFVVVMSFAVCCSNAFQAFLENGVPPFAGKGSPIRFTLDITKANEDWTMSLWKRAVSSWSLRGPRDIDTPYIVGVNEKRTFNTDPKAAPLPASGNLKLIGKTELPFAPEGVFGLGTVTGVSFNEKLNKFAFVTNNAGIYYTDSAIKTVTDHAILDRPNGNDIRVTVDADFWGNNLVAMAQNKTLWGTKLVDPEKVDPWWQWRVFREASPAFADVWKTARPRFNTSRARLSYTTNVTFDALNQAHILTVPDNKQKHSILATFDMSDRKVLSERNLKAHASFGKIGKPLDYYAVGLEAVGNKLLAVSAQYNTLLVIDPERAVIEKTFALPEMVKPHSLTVANGELFILGLEGNKNVIYRVEMPSL